jgi:ABC-type amino acid transport substrate-binding protein
MHRIALTLVAVLALVAARPAASQAPSVAAAPPAAQAAPSAPLHVAVFADEPFVVHGGDGTYSGFAIDLWELIAAKLGRRTEYVPFTDFGAMLAAAKDGKVDIAVGDLFVTSERSKLIDFTQPISDGGLRIMVHERRQHTLGRILHGLWQGGHLVVIGWGLLAAVVLSVPLVLVLRRVDPAFTPHWHEGFAEAFYHVMSIGMTGKTSYKGATGWFSRIFAAIWLVVGVTTVAYVTSSLSSVMTTNALRHEINGTADLAGKSVGVVNGTIGERYASEHHLSTQPFANLDDAVKALVVQDIDAIVYNAPVLEHYDLTHPELPITEVGPVFERLNCAFAVPVGSPLRREVDFELLHLQESGAVARLREHYFGK